MDGIEVHKGLRSLSWRLVPYLAKDANVDIAHQLLANNIEAVCWEIQSAMLSKSGESIKLTDVVLENILAIRKCPMTLLLVIFNVPWK